MIRTLLCLNPILVGTSRCDVPARAAAGGTTSLARSIAPLNAARTAQRAVPTLAPEPFRDSKRKNFFRRILSLCLALGVAQCGVAQTNRSDDSQKQAMALIADNPKLPRVLLIGDSISIDYTLPVRRLLAGKANVHRIPANGGPTTNGLARLAEWLGTSRWDVIHFNWGLHDLKLTATGKHFTPLPQYETNLVILTRRLKATSAALIWANTTPLPRGKLAPPRDRGDEIRFNDAARRVMEQHGVAINDLHGFAVAQGAKLQRPANVHFTADGCDALARQVADAILAELKRRGFDAHSPAPR